MRMLEAHVNWSAAIITTGHAIEYLPIVGEWQRLYRQQDTRVPYLRRWASVGRPFCKYSERDSWSR